jgi:hypothetical protein
MSPRFLLLALCVLRVAHGGSPITRDWKTFPAVVEVEAKGHIYAIGDAHSDYARLARLVRAAGLIEAIPAKPGDAVWTGKNAVLVTTGDMIDKGPRAIDVLRFMRALQLSAREKGGRVVVLAGNHEAEFMADPAAPKGKEFADQLTAAGIRPADVAACKTDLGEFLCSLPFAARVNEWFFSHGGNSRGRTLAQLAADLQNGVMKDGFATKQLVGDGSLLEARLNGTGPGREPWIDAGLPQRSEKQLLLDYAAALGVKHIVEGHVPSEVHFADGTVRKPGEMFQFLGLLFLIDTGMSEGVDSSGGAALRIGPHETTAICPDGTLTPLWDQRNPERSARAAPCAK